MSKGEALKQLIDLVCEYKSYSNIRLCQTDIDAIETNIYAFNEQQEQIEKKDKHIMKLKNLNKRLMKKR